MEHIWLGLTAKEEEDWEEIVSTFKQIFPGLSVDNFSTDDDWGIIDFEHGGKKIIITVNRKNIHKYPPVII